MRWKTLNCISKFRENNTEAMVISKRLKFPKDETFSSPEHVVGKRGVTLVGYKLSQVALGTRMRMTEQIQIL